MSLSNYSPELMAIYRGKFLPSLSRHYILLTLSLCTRRQHTPRASDLHRNPNIKWYTTGTLWSRSPLATSQSGSSNLPEATARMAASDFTTGPSSSRRRPGAGLATITRSAAAYRPDTLLSTSSTIVTPSGNKRRVPT